mgnify:FL=1
MPLQHDFSDKLKEILKNLSSKEKHRYEILMKKIESICACDEFTIEHFKNLRNDMKDLKRVHIDKSFVLTFKYYKAKKYILFEDFDHHDNIYKK